MPHTPTHTHTHTIAAKELHFKFFANPCRSRSLSVCPEKILSGNPLFWEKCSGTGPWMNGHFATAACQDGFGLARLPIRGVVALVGAYRFVMAATHYRRK